MKIDVQRRPDPRPHYGKWANLHRMLLVGCSIFVGTFGLVTLPALHGQTTTYDPQVQRDEVPSDCYQRLAQIETLLRAEELQEAIASLQRLQEEQYGRLITAPSQPLNADFPVVRYIPFRAFAAEWRRNWQQSHRSAWEQYRQSLDSIVAQRLERLSKAPWLEKEMDWEEAMSSRHRPTAMLIAASVAWEKGRVQEARARYQQVTAGLRAQIESEPTANLPASIPWYYVLQHLSDAEWPEELQTHWKSLCENTTSPDHPTTNQLAESLCGLIRCSLADGDVRRADLEFGILERFLSSEVSSYPKQTWLQVARDWIRQSKETFHSTLEPEVLPLQPEPSWHQLLPRRFASRDQEYSTERAAESNDGWLIYHPLVVGSRVYVNRLNAIDAFDRKTGNPWPALTGNGSLFDTEIADADLLPLSYPIAGTMRGTLEAADGILYARVESPVTAWNTRSGLPAGSASSLVAIDIEHSGKLLSGFPLRLVDEMWTGCEFEGTPAIVDDALFVGVTSRSSLQVRRWVACFERNTGRLRWRSPLLAAGALDGMEDKHWISHQRVTHRDGRLFYDTGLGSIVALDAQTGKICWLLGYPRVQVANESAIRSTQYRCRDLTSPLVVGDLVICAPSDCREIFALDWGTGDLIWASDPQEVSDAIHLLGASQGRLFASGESLYAIDLGSGKVLDRFPEAGEGRGLGRGTLIGKHILHPQTRTIVDVVWREDLHRFEERARHDVGIAFEQGANLIYHDGYVVAGGANRVSVFLCREEPETDSIRGTR